MKRRTFLGAIALSFIRLRDAFAEIPKKGPSLPVPGSVVLSVRSANDDWHSVVSQVRPDHVVWLYVGDSQVVTQLKALGVPSISGAVNGTPPASLGADLSIGLSDTPVKLPWLGPNSQPLASSSSNKTVDAYAKWVANYEKIGVDGIQFDDPLMSTLSERYGGGDLSPKAQDNFSTWMQKNRSSLLKGNRFAGSMKGYLNLIGISSIDGYSKNRSSNPILKSWRSFLVLQDSAFLLSIKKIIRGWSSPGYISANLGIPSTSEDFVRPALAVDYVMSEIPTSDFSALSSMKAITQGLNRLFLASPSLKDRSVENHRSFLINCFSNSIVPILPWSIYVPPVNGVNQPRYYGNMHDYADLIAFVRSRELFFKGWEPEVKVAIISPLADGSASSIPSLLSFLRSQNVTYVLVPGIDNIAASDFIKANLDTLRLVVDPLGVLGVDKLTKISSGKDVPVIRGIEMNQSDLHRYVGQVIVASVSDGSKADMKIHANPALPGVRMLHVIRNGGSSESASMELIIPDSDFGRLKAAILHQSSSASSTSGVLRQGASSVVVDIPAPKEWGVIELQYVPT